MEKKIKNLSLSIFLSIGLFSGVSPILYSQVQKNSNQKVEKIADKKSLATLIYNEQQLIRKKSVWKSPETRRRNWFRDGVRELFRLFHQSCNKQLFHDLTAQFKKAGFLPGFVTDKIIILKENNPGFHGGGLYLIRCGQANNLVIQAPHSYFDLKTGRLGIHLFFESHARSLFLNTIHRYQSDPKEKKEDRVHPADVAHEPGSWFHAATIGAALGIESLRFVQLHGFEQRKTPVRMILSSGLRDRPPRALAKNLMPGFSPLQTFGIDSSILGATTNVQQQALNQMTPGRFVHLEMTLPLRENLLNSAKTRKALLEALESEW